MLLQLKQLLTADEVQAARALLGDGAPWNAGRQSAGAQAAQNKHNQQLAQDSAASRQLQALNTGAKIRTDVSATLFLSDPADYDGGELEIEDTYGRHRVKLAAGSMVVYPATSLHQVTPVTRGVRTACFFWTQSLVRDLAHREVLYQMDGAIQRLNQTEADEIARRSLIGCYHNMVRAWSEP